MSTNTPTGQSVFWRNLMHWLWVLFFFGLAGSSIIATVVKQDMVLAICAIIVSVGGLFLAFLQVSPNTLMRLRQSWRLGIQIILVGAFIASITLNIVLLLRPTSIVVPGYKSSTPTQQNSSNSTAVISVISKTPLPAGTATPVSTSATATMPVSNDPDYVKFTGNPPDWTDAMSVASPLRWQENEHCRYQDGSYHVLAQGTNQFGNCFAQSGPMLSNFMLEATVTIVQGHAGGLIFRAMGTTSDNTQSWVSLDKNGYYHFYLDSADRNCQEPNGRYCPALDPPVIGKAYRLALLVRGTDIAFYIDGQFIGNIQSGEVRRGGIGFIGFSCASNTLDLAVRDLKVWKLTGTY